MPLLSQPCCGDGLNEDVMWERKSFLAATTAATENDMVPRMRRTRAEYHFVMDLPKSPRHIAMLVSILFTLIGGEPSAST